MPLLPKKQPFLNVVKNGGSKAAPIKQYTLDDLLELKGIPVCEEINTSECSGPSLSHCYEKLLNQNYSNKEINARRMRKSYEIRMNRR